MSGENPNFSEDKVLKAVETINKGNEDNNFNDEEIQDIQNLLKGLSKVGLEEVQNRIKEVIQAETSNNLKVLLEEVELLHNNGFESLKDSFSGDEVMIDYFDRIDSYMDEKITRKDINSNQKDTIKLVLTDKVQNIILNDKDLLSLFKKTIKPLKNNEISFNELINNPKVKTLNNQIDGYFKNIDNIDIKNTFFNNPNTIEKIIDGETNTEKLNNIGELSEEGKLEYLENIKGNTKKLGEEVKNVLGKEGGLKLSKELKEGLGDLINTIKEKYPILGAILSLFLGFDNSVENGGDKKKQSIDNLVKFANKKDSPLSGLEDDFFNNFDIKKLEDFYTFLESKGISKDEYGKEGFWEGIIVGNTTDSKLIEINLTLSGNPEGNIEDSKKLKGEDFIKKLNGLKLKKTTKEEPKK